mmetsp:Transcript_64433/g.114589  ORF Transcript_64433/g.114589 Transcript_64433/m.114589 type:complete len:539 (+) Transcript_64433:76-1692(+)
MTDGQPEKQEAPGSGSTSVSSRKPSKQAKDVDDRPNTEGSLVSVAPAPPSQFPEEHFPEQELRDQTERDAKPLSLVPVDEAESQKGDRPKTPPYTHEGDPSQEAPKARPARKALRHLPTVATNFDNSLGARCEKCLDRIPMCSIRPLRCLKRPGRMNRCLENNRCCGSVGRRGFRVLGRLRKVVLFFSCFVSFLGIILRAMPAAALHPDARELSGSFDMSWAGGDYDCVRPEVCRGFKASVYIGLDSLLVDVPGVIYKVIPWYADDCITHLESLGAGEYCEICDQASKGCAAMAFLSIAAGITNFLTDIQRMRAKNDHNCIKSTALIANFIGASMLLSATCYFQYYCVSSFPREDKDGLFKLNLRIGRGGLLAASAAGINVLNIMVHLAVPVPEHRWRTWGVFGKDDPCPGEWPPVIGTTAVAPFDSTVPDVDGGIRDRPEDDVQGDGPGWEGDRMFAESPSRSSARNSAAENAVEEDLLALRVAAGTAQRQLHEQGRSFNADDVTVEAAEAQQGGDTRGVVPAGAPPAVVPASEGLG